MLDPTHTPVQGSRARAAQRSGLLLNAVSGLALLLSVSATMIASATAHAAVFELSDAFGVGIGTLSDSQRLELFEQNVPMAKAFGATRLRVTFGDGDTPFAWGQLTGHGKEDKIYPLDDLIGWLNDAGIEPVVVLSQENASDHGVDTLLPTDSQGWKSFVKYIVERYDGDLDFAVSSCADPFPDVDGSGGCSEYDFHSSPEKLRQAWADRHLVHAYQIEDMPFEAIRQGLVAPEDYAALVAMTTPGIRSLVPDGFEVEVLLGGVRFAKELKPHFVQTMSSLVALASGNDAALPDGADLHLTIKEGQWLTGEAYADALEEFPQWMSAAGMQALPVTVGRVTASAGQTSQAPWEGGASPKGTCGNDFCSERSQIESLLKGFFLSRWASDAPFFVSNLFEFVGSALYANTYSYNGLVIASGESMLGGAFEPRPAYAILRYLNERFPDLPSRDFVEVFPVPANARVFEISDSPIRAWIAWYDWVKEVPAGQEYLGIGKNVTIRDIDAPFLRVTHLFLDDVTGVDPQVERLDLDLVQDFVEVVEGIATLEIKRDMLLLEAWDEAIVAPDSADSAEVIGGEDALGSDLVGDEASGGGSSGGGCALGRGDAPGSLGSLSGLLAWSLALLALVVLRASRRREPGKVA